MRAAGRTRTGMVSRLILSQPHFFHFLTFFIIFEKNLRKYYHTFFFFSSSLFILCIKKRRGLPRLLMWPSPRDTWPLFPERNILWPLLIHEPPWLYRKAFRTGINQISAPDLPDHLALYELPRYYDVLFSRFHTYFISEHLFDVK